MGIKKIFGIKPPEEMTDEQNREYLMDLGVPVKNLNKKKRSKFAAYGAMGSDRRFEKTYAPPGYEEYAKPGNATVNAEDDEDDLNKSVADYKLDDDSSKSDSNNPYSRNNTGANPYDRGAGGAESVVPFSAVPARETTSNPYSRGSDPRATNFGNTYESKNSAHPNSYERAPQGNPYGTASQSNPYAGVTNNDFYGKSSQTNPYGNTETPSAYDSSYNADANAGGQNRVESPYGASTSGPASNAQSSFSAGDSAELEKGSDFAPSAYSPRPGKGVRNSNNPFTRRATGNADTPESNFGSSSPALGRNPSQRANRIVSPRGSLNPNRQSTLMHNNSSSNPYANMSSNVYNTNGNSNTSSSATRTSSLKKRNSMSHPYNNEGSYSDVDTFDFEDPSVSTPPGNRRDGEGNHNNYENVSGEFGSSNNDSNYNNEYGQSNYKSNLGNTYNGDDDDDFNAAPKQYYANDDLNASIYENEEYANNGANEFGSYQGGSYNEGNRGYKTFEELREEEQMKQQQMEDEEVDEIKQNIRFTKQSSVASTRNTLKMAQDAEMAGMNTLGMLGNQSEKLNNIESNLSLMKVQNRTATHKVDDLKKYNRSVFAVHVGNPFTSKRRLREKEEQIKQQRMQDKLMQEHVDQELYSSVKRIGGAMDEVTKTDELKDRYQRREILEKAKRYQFEQDEEDDDMEHELDKNLNHISDISGRLRKLAIATGQEVDKQQGRLREIEDDTDNLDINIHLNTHRLHNIK
ncbi:hypothetical protein ACO0RG_002354 [Hanseniaspora osmophila]